MRRLRDLGEHAWIGRLVRRLDRLPRARRILVGPGDDAAVLRGSRRALLITTDTLAEGVHFRRGWTTPAALGRRAFGVNASDVAAMGGIPTAAVMALEAPASTAVADLDAVVTGFAAAARRAGARLVGGNVSAGPRLVITVTLLGEVPGRAVTRAGARPGDMLFVTGTLGAAGLAVRRLAAGRRTRWSPPPLRLRAGRTLAGVAHAMIDVSDGMVQDLGHMCRASGVAADIELARLPVAVACRRAFGRRAAAFAATAGEDYELIVAVAPRQEAAVRRLRARLGCRLTRIGWVRAGRSGVRVLDAAGQPVRLRRSGFDHFR